MRSFWLVLWLVLPARAADFDAPRAPEALPADLFAAVAAPSAALPAVPASLTESLVSKINQSAIPGVFIQQEHEGSLVAADPRDSSGNVFRYYRAAEVVPEIARQVKAGMTLGEKTAYVLRSLTTRDDWKRFPTAAKLKYLAAYEERVASEGGRDSAWDGDRFRLLIKRDDAPAFIAEHPVMEAPPEGYAHLSYNRFLRPEIVSAQGAPARTGAAAIHRAKMVIGDTAHAGVHFHVFMKLKPEELRARLPAIESVLQLANNVAFAEAAAQSPLNLAHAYLTPWHAGRSRRVEQLVARAGARPEVSPHGDPDSEKFAFLAFRYWGIEDGLMTVSFELRGVDLPWRGGPKSMMRGIEDGGQSAERDYGSAERRLAFATALAGAVLKGTIAPAAVPEISLDEAAAQRALDARAAERGIPRGAYASLAELSREVFGAPHGYDGPLPGLLLPFSTGAAEPSAEQARRAFLDQLLDQAARLRSLTPGPLETTSRRQMQYLLWSAYAGWARPFALAQSRRLDAVFVGLARN